MTTNKIAIIVLSLYIRKKLRTFITCFYFLIVAINYSDFIFYKMGLSLMKEMH